MVKRLLLLALFVASSNASFAQAGSLDTTFNVGIGFDSTITTFALQPDGKIIVGGNFANFNGISRNCIARLNSDGTLDTTFSVGMGFTGYAQPLWSGITGTLPEIETVVCVNSIVVQPSSKIVVAGNFYRYNNKYCGGGIVRLNSDGSLDTSFIQGNSAADTNTFDGSSFLPLAGVWLEFPDYPLTGDTLTKNGGLQHLLQQADGSIITNGLAGIPVTIGFYGTASISTDVFRFSGTTGNLDAGFSCSTFCVPLAQQTDGKVIVSGGSENINRMNTNGSLDGTFNLSSGSDSTVNAAVIQPDGHIIIGGAFTTYDAVSRNYITRINTDRSQDATFSVGTGFNLPVNSLALQSDGKVIVGGNFITYNSVLHNRIARLNNDGSIDTSFITGTGFDSKVNQVLLQPDGKILVSGTFTNYNGTVRNKMARLNAVDTSLPASGVQSVSLSSKITISPNPAQSQIKIASAELITSVGIKNELGQTVFADRFNNNNVNINIERLPSGIYFITVNDSNIYKVVKQ